MKAKCPVFYFLDLDGGILKLIYLKIRKADLYENRNGRNLHCFEKFFSLKPSEQLWNHGPDLSTQYCQEGTRPHKKVKNNKNSEVNSSFSNFTSLELVFARIVHLLREKADSNKCFCLLWKNTSL